MNWRALLWWRPPCLLRTVIVNLRDPDDVALRGVLWQSRGSWLVLRDVAAIRAGLPPTPIDGEAVIERPNCAFMQVLP